MAGAVAGTPGETYGQRSDLNQQPVRAATGQPYGVAGQQRAAQQAVPLPEGGGLRQLPTPLGAPSSRPNEPMTHGMPFGDGPNTPVGMTAQQTNRTLERLRSLYTIWPDEGVRQLIQRMEETGQ